MFIITMKCTNGLNYDDFRTGAGVVGVYNTLTEAQEALVGVSLDLANAKSLGKKVKTESSDLYLKVVLEDDTLSASRFIYEIVEMEEGHLNEKMHPLNLCKYDLDEKESDFFCTTNPINIES